VSAQTTAHSLRKRRRCVRQRARRVVRRQLQDRADHRPRLAQPHTARARDRRILGWFNNARLHESLADIPPAE